MRRLAWALLPLLAGCGDDGPASTPPGELSAGPVTIDPATMTLTIGDLTSERFVSIGTVEEVDARHYYDPRGDAAVTLEPVARAIGSDGDSVILDGGARMRLTTCEGMTDCAVLELDASTVDRAVQLQVALPRGEAEPLYGTGDAPIRANVAGTVRELQLRLDPDSESSLNETHVPVPLVLWPRRGIGMFVADDRPGALDLGAAQADRVAATFTLPARGTYAIYLFTAATPLDLVRTYTALTTKPAVPPRWAFAPQQWRNVWDSADQVRGDATEMRTRHIPGSVMWIDNPWQTAYNTFVVDETRLAQPAQLVADLTARGYKVVFWSTPYVGTTPATAADHADGAANDFFVTDDGGGVIDFPWQDGPGALVDFTRPGATEWWRERIARVTGIGAAGFKLDFGEELVSDLAGTVVTFLLADGDNSLYHRRYAEGYHRAYLGALPDGDGFLITRAGAWGEQYVNTAIWPGDLAADFSIHGEDNGSGQRNVGGLPSAMSRGLSLSVSGYPFYGSDIGGFRGFPTTEALLRWAEYAAFGTIMQLGGGGKNHNPWDTTLFDAGADVIYKTYADLHMQLNPLLWTLAQRAGQDGTPVTRPAAFVYDCACDDAMFLLGDDILVAPVVEPGATTRTVVLPAGDWVEVATGVTITGDGASAVTVPAALGELPRWQRAGSFVPMFARAADTLLPATVAGITSYATRAIGRELRLVYAPAQVAATTTLHDGATATGTGATVTLATGTEYTVFTVDIDARALAAPFSSPTAVALDGTDLPTAADVATCAAPGCWHFAAATKRLAIRVFGSGSIAIR
ncbi:MAG TPA: glycoside hydrolase family 31 protein [Kofleriaceae bacterium]|nr:glycoside hydrolase family 31 protein [Kofleriaceae bacterium]